MPNEVSILCNSHQQSEIRQQNHHGGMVADGRSSGLFPGSAGSMTSTLWLYLHLLFLRGFVMTGHKAGVCSWAGLRGSAWLAAGHAGLWEQGAVLLWCLQLKLVAEAAVPEPTLEEDTGNEETRPLSPVFTGTETGEGVFVHASVCLSFPRTDWLTDCRSRWCMHDLSHSCLWKQHFSGPGESHWQEVVTSLDEQNKQNAKERWHISVIQSDKIEFNWEGEMNWKLKSAVLFTWNRSDLFGTGRRLLVASDIFRSRSWNSL